MKTRKNYHDLKMLWVENPHDRGCYRDFEGLYGVTEVLEKCRMGDQFVWDILEIQDEQLKAMVRDMTINLVNEHLNTSDEVSENEAFTIAHTVYEMITVRWWMKTDLR